MRNERATTTFEQATDVRRSARTSGSSKRSLRKRWAGSASDSIRLCGVAWDASATDEPSFRIALRLLFPKRRVLVESQHKAFGYRPVGARGGRVRLPSGHARSEWSLEDPHPRACRRSCARRPCCRREAKRPTLGGVLFLRWRPGITTGPSHTAIDLDTEGAGKRRRGRSRIRFQRRIRRTRFSVSMDEIRRYRLGLLHSFVSNAI